MEPALAWPRGSNLRIKKKHLIIDLNHEISDRQKNSFSHRPPQKSEPHPANLQHTQTERHEEKSQCSDQHPKTEADNRCPGKTQFSQSLHTKNSPSLFDFIAKMKSNSVQTAPAEVQSQESNTLPADIGNQTHSEISAKSQDDPLIGRLAWPKDKLEKVKSALTGVKVRPPALVKPLALPVKVQTPPNISNVLFDPKQATFKRQTMTANFLKEKLGDKFEVVRDLFLKENGNTETLAAVLDQEQLGLVKLFPIAFGFATPTTQGSLNFAEK